MLTEEPPAERKERVRYFAAKRQQKAREKRAKTIGTSLTDLLRHHAKIERVLTELKRREVPEAVELLKSHAAMRKLILELKPTKLGKLPEDFPTIENVGRRKHLDLDEE